jgi:hypothetical protein
MPCRRCSVCGENWPDEALYGRCPECREPTSRFGNTDSMSSEEGASRIAHIEFEKHYERHCAQRGVPVEGDLPIDLAELLPDLA